MLRIFFLPILIVASIATTYGAAVPQEDANINLEQQDRLIYIGSAQNRPLTQPGQKIAIAPASSITRESHYFQSQNAAAYEKAKDDCKNQLGDDSSLLSIETQEELANVTEFILSSGDTGSVYWTSGKYNVENRAFEWENGVRLNPSGPWDVREPKTQTLRTRVAVRIRDVPKLATYFNTVSQRYICELVQGDEGEMAEPCYNDNDLVIVVDSSGSIGQDKYITALDFAANLATTWVDNPGNRISVIIYSSGVQTIIGLNEKKTVSQIRELVYNAPYLSGGTASDLGINQAVTEFQNNVRSVPKNMVFLTDGASEHPSATATAAQNAEAAGIRSFSIGIGSGINQQELLAIAGNNANHIFNTGGFEDLLKLLQPVSRRVCP